MRKVIRILSTILVAVGIVFLLLYAVMGAGNKTAVLDRPSYFQVQKYWFIFLAGAIGLIFDELASFFSWFRALDIPRDALLNPVSADKKQIHTWVSGTGLDTVGTTGRGGAPVNGRTEIVDTPAATVGTAVGTAPQRAWPGEPGNPPAGAPAPQGRPPQATEVLPDRRD